MSRFLIHGIQPSDDDGLNDSSVWLASVRQRSSLFSIEFMTKGIHSCAADRIVPEKQLPMT